MADLTQLLAVQQLDTRLDQLRHRLANHPARQSEGDARQELARARTELAGAEQARDELLREQRRWGDEVAKVAARRAEIDQSLYGGTVTSPKELVALQADAESLLRRQRDLEDHELEVMEQVEVASAAVDERVAAVAAIEDRLEDLAQELTAATAEIEVEVEHVSRDRAEAAAPLPADVLQRYEALRAELGGVAVARLNGSTCDGCHLRMSAVEVDRIRKLPPEALVLCEECGRILVR